jgi:hypothetical protein
MRRCGRFCAQSSADGAPARRRRALGSRAVAASLLLVLTLGGFGRIAGASGATKTTTTTTETTTTGVRANGVDVSHQRSDLGDILSDLRNSINQVENMFNAGKNAFNQVGAAFNDLSREIQSFPGKVNGVKSEVGKLVGTIGDKVEGFLDEVYGKLFPTDAGSMVSDISGKFSPTASLGEGGHGPHFEDISAIGSLVRRLNQDVLRDDLRRVLYNQYASQLGAAHKRAAELGCSTLPANTTDAEAAKLGCTSITSLSRVCYDAPMRDLFPETAFSQEYEMPWPKKLGSSPFSPAKFEVGFPVASWETCAGINKFNIPTKVATDLINAFRLFFGALFDGIKEGAMEAATEAKNAVMVPVNAIDAQIAVINSHLQTAQNHMNSISNVFGGRRLLSEEEIAEHHHELRRHTEALAASIAHADFVYKSQMQRIEDQVLLGLEQIREVLILDPLLQDPKKMANFPDYDVLLRKRAKKMGVEHETAELGDAVEKMRSARQALTNAMAELKNTDLDIGVTSDLELTLAATLKGDAFVQGDFFESIMEKTKAPIENPTIIRKTVMGAYGFYVNLAFGVGFKLPYFAKADAEATIEYGLSIPDMKIGIKSEKGQFSVYFDPPKPHLSEEGLEASVSAHLQVGAELEIPMVQIELCWAGAICSGPQVYFSQGAQVGLDMFAATMSTPPPCFDGETTLASYFTDFDYPSKPAECSLTGSGMAAGVGAYYQVPKPDALVKLVTTISSPCEVDVPDVVLYKSSKDDGFFAQAQIFPPQCAADITAGSEPPPGKCT